MNLERQLQKAVDYAKSGDQDRAIPLFTQALQQQPQNGQLRIYLAKSLGLAFRLEECEALIGHLLQATQRSPAILIEVAKTWEELDRRDLALSLWEEAAEKGVPGAWSHVALLQERLNQIEAATDSLAKGQETGEVGPRWHWVSGRLAQRSGDLPSSRAAFEYLYERTPKTEWGRRAAHSLAQVKDREGDYAGAWSWAAKAKEPTLAAAAELRKRVSLPKPAPIPIAKIPEWSEEFPLTLLAGFPRSGTSLTCRLLVEATGFQLSDESLAMQRMLQIAKAQVGHKAFPREIRNARKAYRAAIKATLGADLAPGLIDKNPAMSLWGPWIQLILPETQVLWVSRDWREIALSCWFTDFPLNALTAHFQDWDHLAAVLALGSAHRNYWKTHSSPENFQEVTYEEIVTAGRLPQQAIDFCLKGENPAPTTNKATNINSLTYAEAIKPPTRERLGRWEHYSEFAPANFEALVNLG